MGKDNSKFKELLDETYCWPCSYTFKFIVPKGQVALAKQILIGLQLSEKASGKGNYISITATKIFNGAEEIILIYQKMAIVEGVVSL